MDLVGDVLDELALVDLIGELGDDDPGAVLSVLLELCPRLEDNLAPAGQIGLADAAAAHDDAAGRKVGPGQMLHQVRHRRLGVIQHADAGVDDLGEVVGRDVRGHADRDAAGAVDQQVRKARGQDTGLLPAFVEVRVPVDGVLFDIAQHLVRDFGKPRFGVSVGGRGVAVHGTEVAVPVDQHVAHRKVLREADHGVIDRGVAVGVVVTQHVADAGRRLLEGLVRGKPRLVHRVQNAPVHGLETVAHIGQGAADNDAHGVVDVAALHLADELGLGNHLIRKENVFRFVISLMCHLSILKCPDCPHSGRSAQSIPCAARHPRPSAP